MLMIWCDGDTMDGLNAKFQRWREALEQKGLKVNLEKTKTMVSGSEGEIHRSKIDPCRICGKRVMANSVKCTKCGEWIHGRCTKMKRVTPYLARQSICKRCKAAEEFKSEELVEKYKDIKMVDGLLSWR